LVTSCNHNHLARHDTRRSSLRLNTKAKIGSQNYLYAGIIWCRKLDMFY